MRLDSVSSNLNAAFGICFIIGLVVIYVPQYYKIYATKTSYGLSNVFMMLGNAATFLSSVNSLIYYINALPCGRETKCSEEFMGLAIIILQWFLFLLNYIMFLKYHPCVLQANPFKQRELKTKRDVVWGFVISNFILMIFLATSLGLLARSDWHYDTSDPVLIVWCDFLEIVVTSLFLLHYVPQIWETYQLKDVGSISLISLGIMCPGSFIWTGFLASQSLITDNPNASKPQVWIPYLIVSLMQLVLLIMGCYFEHQKKKKSSYLLLIDDAESEDGVNYETREPNSV